MRTEERKRLLAILNEGIENDLSADAGGIVRSPVSDYTSESLLAQEQQTFFRDTPLFVGLSSDLPNANTYWAENSTGLPILMVRDEESRFRAFGNVCRHRGAQVVPNGRGRADRFSCPFHAWTYNTSGNLIAVNRERKFGSVCKKTHSLVELPSAEKYGMLWVKPSPGGEIDIDACLGGLADDMKHWKLDEHKYGASQMIHADINWKLAIDTFGENYHFDVLHRYSLAQEIKGNLQTHDVFDSNYRMVFAYQSFPDTAKQFHNQEDWPFRYMTLCVYFIYPNAIFLVDPHAVDVLRIFPEDNATNKSKTLHSWYVEPSVRHYFDEDPKRYDERFTGFNSIIKNEDYLVAASSQRGAESGLFSHILFGRNEPALHHYHNVHRKGLNRPLLELEKVD